MFVVPLVMMFIPMAVVTPLVLRAVASGSIESDAPPGSADSRPPGGGRGDRSSHRSAVSEPAVWDTDS
jgi:hypothetical protein